MVIKILSRMESSENDDSTASVESPTHTVKDQALFKECLKAGFDKTESSGQAVSCAANVGGGAVCRTQVVSAAW